MFWCPSDEELHAKQVCKQPERKLKLFTCIVAFLKLHDEVVGVGFHCCILDFIQWAAFKPVFNVLSDGAREEHWLLVHHRDLLNTQSTLYM